jgi:hypothetical protein
VIPWVLLDETTEYSILGRHEPDDEHQRREGRVGQDRSSRILAVMGRSAHARLLPDFLMVRPLCDPETPFEDAIQAFRQRAG